MPCIEYYIVYQHDKTFFDELIYLLYIYIYISVDTEHISKMFTDKMYFTRFPTTLAPSTHSIIKLSYGYVLGTPSTWLKFGKDYGLR